MIDALFVEFTVIMLIATVISVLMRMLRQPQIIGYIITGVLVSRYVFDVIHSHEMVGFLSEVGVAFLLFIVGIHLSPKEAREVGGVAAISGFAQFLVASLIGFGIALALGMSLTSALYLGIALSFSSTIIVMKLLTDRGEIDTLHGKLAVGILLVQDLIAVVALLVITSLSAGQSVLLLSAGVLLKIGLTIAGMALFTSYALPWIDRLLRKSHEILFIFSISWMFALAALFTHLGFSIEVGALIAGVTLATSMHRYEISTRIKPLRDFFIILFFILIGTYVDFTLIVPNLLPIIGLSAFVLVGTPAVVVVTLLLLGYARRTAWITGLIIAQVSEFSIIMVKTGIVAGQVDQSLLAITTTIAVLTIAGSTYLLKNERWLYERVKPWLTRLEREKPNGQVNKKRSYDIIIFGFHRSGYSIVRQLKRAKKRILVVDYDPAIVTQLERLKVPAAFGDVNDHEFLGELDFTKAKMIVSTVPSLEANMVLLRRARQENPEIITILTAYQIDEAEQLYAQNATYVLMPHFLSGEASASIIAEHGFDLSKFLKTRQKHISHLRRRSDLGHGRNHEAKRS